MGHIGVMPAPAQWLLLAAMASVYRIASTSPLPNPDPNPNPLPSPNPNPAPAPFLPPFNLLTQLLGFGQSSGTLDGSLDAPHKSKKCKRRSPDHGPSSSDDFNFGSDGLFDGGFGGFGGGGFSSGFDSEFHTHGHKKKPKKRKCH